MYVENDEIPYMNENGEFIKPESPNKIKNKILELLSYEGFTLAETQHLFDRTIREIKIKNKINL